jgi:hypothetical protein
MIFKSRLQKALILAGVGLFVPLIVGPVRKSDPLVMSFGIGWFFLLWALHFEQSARERDRSRREPGSDKPRSK